MSYFVVRDTDHPQADLDRNWSSTVGGVNYNGDFAFASLEEAQEKDPNHEYRFHPAHDGFAIVDYEGLGAFALESEGLAEALVDANEYEDDLACCLGSGDGHFFAHEVKAFHKVREGRYIFELK